MVKFHSLIVKDIRKETADCISVAFAVPAELQQDYDFIQGQYLTLKTIINGENVRRSYSICSSPLEGELRVAIKLLEGGVFSTYAHTKMQVGESLDVMTPIGKFNTPLDSQNAKHYVAFAAGSGITPIMSIIKTVLAKEPKSQFTLIYGNKSRNSIIFKEEIEALKNKNIERLSIYHVLSREFTDSPLLHGRIDAEKCEKFFHTILPTTSIDEAFICGPEEMIHDVRVVLEKANVSNKKIHFELFTTSTPAQKPIINIPNSADKRCKVSVQLDGNTFEMQMKYGEESVLDAALKQGADLPFACKGGVCCTCRAKLLEGEVEMGVNYALEPEEVAEGYILTCQSYPITESIKLSFDLK